PAGCLLIVKNYTGDRLNFGLAAERARAFGHRVEMVIVDDDVALPDLAQARGVAGTLFVHKIAGAMAEAGASLEEVSDAAQSVVERIASIGMSVSTCTVPGNPKEERIPEGQAELGLGIHGEAGIEQVLFEGASAAIATMAERLAPHMGNGRHVALLNNLGGVTPLEMSILTAELANSVIGDKLGWIVGPAPMMTSLDMRGVSISILEPSEAETELLAAPTQIAAWPGVVALQAPTVLPLPDGLTPIRPMPSGHPEHRDLVARCCQLMVAAERDLNALDAQSGDGDTGSTLATAARALEGALDQLPLADLTQLYRAIGMELSQVMGGSSGVLLAIFFTATGDASARGLDTIDALSAGLDRVREVGGAQLGDRTMIDALAPALGGLGTGLDVAARAAREGADATASITKARAGRASYLSESKLRGHNDPGAEAVARLFEGLVREYGQTKQTVAK
ncbi:MAG: dihydroxyacetone kinase subunit DhaK, partial [Pseudomonadota bacterium]